MDPSKSISHFAFRRRVQLVKLLLESKVKMPGAKWSTAPAKLEPDSFIDAKGNLYMKALCAICSRAVAHRVDGVNPTITFKAYEEDLEDGAPKKYSRSYQNMKTQISYHGASRNGTINPFHLQYQEDSPGWDASPPAYAEADRAVEEAQHASTFCEVARNSSCVDGARNAAKSALVAATASQAASDAFAAIASAILEQAASTAAAQHATKTVATHRARAKAAAERAANDAEQAAKNADAAKHRAEMQAEQRVLLQQVISESFERSSASESIETTVRRLASRHAIAVDAINTIRQVTPDGVETARRMVTRAASLYHSPSTHLRSDEWWCLSLPVDAIAHRLAMQEQRYAWVGEMAQQLAKDAYPEASARPCGGWVKQTVDQRLSYWLHWRGRRGAPVIDDTIVPMANESAVGAVVPIEPATTLSELCACSVVRDPSRVLPTHMYRGKAMHIPPFSNLHQLLVESTEPVVMAEVPGLAFRMYFEITSKPASQVSSATVMELVQRFDATPHAMEILEEGSSLRVVFPTLIVDRERAMLMREALLATVEAPVHVATYDEPLAMPGTSRQVQCAGCEDKPKARKQCPTCNGKGLTSGGRIGSVDDLDRLSIHSDGSLTPTWKRFAGCPSLHAKPPCLSGLLVKDERIRQACQTFIRTRWSRKEWREIKVDAVFRHHGAYQIAVSGIGSSTCLNMVRGDHPCSRIWFLVDREGFSQKCDCKDPTNEGRRTKRCSEFRSLPAKKLERADLDLLFAK